MLSFFIIDRHHKMNNQTEQYHPGRIPSHLASFLVIGLISIDCYEGGLWSTYRHNSRGATSTINPTPELFRQQPTCPQVLPCPQAAKKQTLPSSEPGGGRRDGTSLRYRADATSSPSSIVALILAHRSIQT